MGRPQPPIAVRSGPGRWLRLEGLALLVFGLWAYLALHGTVAAFLTLALLPDASMLLYLGGNAIGAGAYNLMHSTVGAALLAAAGLLTAHPWMLQGAAIWVCHIGGDRLLGFGLKYPSGFRDNHLQRV